MRHAYARQLHLHHLTSKNPHKPHQMSENAKFQR